MRVEGYLGRGESGERRWRLAKLDDSYFGDGWLRLAPSLFRYLSWRRRRTYGGTLQTARVRTGARKRKTIRISEVHSDLRAGSRSGDWRAAFSGGMSRRDADQLAWS